MPCQDIFCRNHVDFFTGRQPVCEKSPYPAKNLSQSGITPIFKQGLINQFLNRIFSTPQYKILRQAVKRRYASWAASALKTVCRFSSVLTISGIPRLCIQVLKLAKLPVFSHAKAKGKRDFSLYLTGRCFSCYLEYYHCLKFQKFLLLLYIFTNIPDGFRKQEAKNGEACSVRRGYRRTDACRGDGAASGIRAALPAF